MDKRKRLTMEELTAFTKRRGFVFQGSAIYGGVAGLYDFGPYGVELLNNLKNHWWNFNVRTRENYVGLDSAMFKAPEVWVASGHVSGFSDPLAECKNCNTRVRVDKELEKLGVFADEKMSEEEIQTLFAENEKRIKCPNCKKTDWSKPKKFNLLVKSNLGDFTEKNEKPVYLPGEACQGIYLNYKNVVDTCRVKIPFGIAQIGKAFRNEISPRNFLFRCREFEQADTQFFIRPHENKENYERIKQEQWNWLVSLGIDEKNLRWHQHENLVFYAKDAWDIEYNYLNYGYDELMGIHDRSDYDLTQHMKYSGTDLSYVDKQSGEKYVPWILETSMGMGRLFLAVLADALVKEQTENGGERIVLRLLPALAPVKVAVFPLLKNKPELVKKAKEIYNELSKQFACEFDDSGNIGKCYRRQDEIGTPYCITIDFQTLEDNTVTIRDRDTMSQHRLSIDEITSAIKL